MKILNLSSWNRRNPKMIRFLEFIHFWVTGSPDQFTFAGSGLVHDGW